MKVQFLTEKYLRYAFLWCLLMEADIFIYGMRSMWNRTSSRDDMNLEHAF